MKLNFRDSHWFTMSEHQQRSNLLCFHHPVHFHPGLPAQRTIPSLLGRCSLDSPQRKCLLSLEVLLELPLHEDTFFLSSFLADGFTIKMNVFRPLGQYSDLLKGQQTMASMTSRCYCLISNWRTQIHHALCEWPWGPCVPVSTPMALTALRGFTSNSEANIQKTWSNISWWVPPGWPHLYKQFVLINHCLKCQYLCSKRHEQPCSSTCSLASTVWSTGSQLTKACYNSWNKTRQSGEYTE